MTAETNQTGPPRVDVDRDEGIRRLMGLAMAVTNDGPENPVTNDGCNQHVERPENPVTNDAMLDYSMPDRWQMERGIRYREEQRGRPQRAGVGGVRLHV